MLMVVGEIEKDLVHYVKKIDFLLEHLRELQVRLGKKRLRALDMGCGTGNISLAAARTGCEVTGIDVDRESVAYAQRRKIPHATFFVGNAQDLQLQDEYEVIICSEVLEHLKQPEKLVEFMGKHLHPDGFVFLSIPNGYGPSELSVMPRRILGKILRKLGWYETARNLRHAMVRNPMDKAKKTFGTDTLNHYGEGALHEHFFSLRGLRKLLEEYTLRIVEKQHSFILLGTFPFYYVICRSKRLQRMDCKAADWLPANLASGWAFILKHKGAQRSPYEPSAT